MQSLAQGKDLQSAPPGRPQAKTPIAIPFAIPVLIIGVLLILQGVFGLGSATGGEPASIRYLPRVAGHTDPMAVLDAARQMAVDDSDASGLAMNPRGHYWLVVLPEARSDAASPQALALEISKLRPESAMFWLVDRDGAESPQALSWKFGKAGVLIDIPAERPARFDVVGQLDSESINRPAAHLWEMSALRASVEVFERQGGLLFGAVLVLTVFSAIIALLNWELTFLYFSAWMVTTLRVIAVNSGWDLYWLGVDLDPVLEQAALQAFLAAHALLTVALFMCLFRGELSRLGQSHHRLSLFAGYLAVQTLVAPALDSTLFLPLLWSTSALGMLAMMGLTLRMLRREPNLTLVLYAGSWGFVFAGLLNEVLHASGLVVGATGWLNVRTGLAGGVLLTAVSLAAKMRTDHLEKRIAQRNERAALKLLRQTFDKVPSALFTIDLNGNIEQSNPAFRALFPRLSPTSGRQSVNWRDLLGVDSLAILLEACAKDNPAYLELEVPDDSGETRTFGIRAAALDEHIEGSAMDLTRQKKAEARLRFLADHDPLTGLLNRRGLESVLTRASERVRAGESVAIAYLDLDRFKLVNDLFGHTTGDQVLSQVAARLLAQLDDQQSVARIGGDEFVLILSGMSLKEASDLSESLLDSIRRTPFRFQEKAFSIDGSIGVVALSPTISPAEALTFCDRVCGEAKQAGGSRVVARDESNASLRALMQEIKLVAGMKERLPTESLFTEFQPIVSLTAPESSLCYEVLLRMRDAQGQTIPPTRFIMAAERNGIMSGIDKWVLRSTLEWLDQRPAHCARLKFLTVNLSGASLNDERFVADAVAIVREHPGVIRKVCFEITESVALYDLASTMRFIEKVKAHGAMLALDDFGAGYTSFSYLKDMPADLVKIDGTFIRDIHRDRSNYAITRSIVDLTHELGMSTVAEWAENVEIVEALMRLKVEYAQGFGISRPQAPTRIEQAASVLDLIETRPVRDLLSGTSAPATIIAQRSPTLTL